MRNYSRGHSLLEALVATGIFILVSVALSGVWVMYGKALAKSGEIIAANAVARSVTEGLSANGWDWLRAQGDSTGTLSDVLVERVVRGRKANITYKVSYALSFNDSDAIFPPIPDPSDSSIFVVISPDICRMVVKVQWNSPGGGKAAAGSDYNSETNYSALVYKHGI